MMVRLAGVEPATLGLEVLWLNHRIDTSFQDYRPREKLKHQSTPREQVRCGAAGE